MGRILALIIFLAPLFLCSPAGAQGKNTGDYPNKSIRLIVPFAPGGGTDIIARLLGKELTGRLGQSVIVDNRGGAGGAIGTELGIKAPPDGYTFTLGSASYAANAALFNLPYDPIRDMTSVIFLGDSPMLVVVNPALPAANVRELVALAKAKPKTLTYGSSGTGSMSHLYMELFDIMAGTQTVHIPYKGTGQTLNDLIGGQISMMLGTTAATLPHIRSKRLRALAVTSSTRNSAFPEFPTVTESGVPGYEAVTWYAVWGPRGVPKPIVDLWNAEITRAAALPEIQSRFVAEAIDPKGGPPEVLDQLVAREIAKWKKVVQ